MATSIDDNAADEQSGKSMCQLFIIRCTSTPFNKRHCRQSRTANLHRLITFHNQSADLSACAGIPLADFRRFGEHSDCFENTV